MKKQAFHSKGIINGGTEISVECPEAEAPVGSQMRQGSGQWGGGKASFLCLPGGVSTAANMEPALRRTGEKSSSGGDTIPGKHAHGVPLRCQSGGRGKAADANSTAVPPIFRPEDRARLGFSGRSECESPSRVGAALPRWSSPSDQATKRPLRPIFLASFASFIHPRLNC
jgi:hypothetical protein